MRIAIITFGILVVLCGIAGLFFKEISFYGSAVSLIVGIFIVGIAESWRRKQ
jgi:hypothetical protein